METNNIEQLKENIRQYIKQNGNKEITGQILQEVLLGMVDGLVGNDAVANPEGEAAEILEKIGIAGINYTAPQGPQGPQGVSPTVQVTQTENGYHVVITDKDGPHAFDLTNGPANTLIIGTVTDGEQASASITGEAPNQQLNLVLPKGEQGDPGQNAVNPFKGWYTTANIPTTGQEGDYCNVSDTSVTPHIVTIYRWSTAQNAFVNTNEVPDTANGETFASSEELNKVVIDDSHLVNPVNTADSTQPVLSRAEDVMQLNSKLEGVTASETKATVITLDGNYINGDNGMPSGTGWVGMVAKIELQTANYVRFLGREFPSTNTIADFGYSFGYYDGSTFVPIKFARFDRNPNIAENGYKEYLLQIPIGATHLLTNQRASNSTPFSVDFYCYLGAGEQIEKSIGIDILKEKTNNINYEKNNFAFDTNNVLENSYVSGVDGLIKSLTGYNTYIVRLDGACKLNFSGMLIRRNVVIYDIGFAFGDFINDVWTPSLYLHYDKNTSTTNTATQVIDRSIDVNVSSPYFAFSLSTKFAPCAYCELIKIIDNSAIGKTFTNNDVISLNLDENYNSNVVFKSTLDSIAYGGKSYREIFERTLYCDGENTFDLQGFEFYDTGTNPIRETEIVDSGEYSILFQNAQSWIRAKTTYIYQNVRYYIACRIYRPNAPAETKFAIVSENTTVVNKKGANTQFETISSIFTPVGIYASRLYIGQGSAADGSISYMDTFVVVPLSIFNVPPTKEQLDELYSNYVEIKRNGSINQSISVVSSKLLEGLQDNYGFTDLECMQEFMSAMNAKAKKLGMSDSHFSNPYGGDKYGYNWVTVEDMMKMMVNATSYPVLMDYASQNTIVDLPIYGPQSRMEQYPSSENAFLNSVESAYTDKHGSGSQMPYLAISHKGAGWGDLNNHNAASKVRGVVGTAIIKCNNLEIKNVAYAIFCAAENYPHSPNTYCRGLVDLLDICKAYYDGVDITSMDTGVYQYAMAVELPICNPECYKNNLALNVIYKTAKIVDGEEVKFHTASACKVLATMVILDTFNDLYQMFDINHYDEDYDSTFLNPNDSGSFEGHAGDIYSLDTALYAILGRSNGVFTLSMARHAGAKMLYNKKMKGVIS